STLRGPTPRAPSFEAPLDSHAPRAEVGRDADVLPDGGRPRPRAVEDLARERAVVTTDRELRVVLGDVVVLDVAVVEDEPNGEHAGADDRESRSDRERDAPRRGGRLVRAANLAGLRRPGDAVLGVLGRR